MKFHEKFCKPVAAVFTAFLLLITAASSEAALAANFTIIPPDESPAQTGKTYGDWSSAWWQYVMSIPMNDNPIIDATGEKCQIGQDNSSPVFFLASTTGGNLTRNECRVPAGKMLFLPLLSTAYYRDASSVNKEPEHAIRNRLNSFIRSTRQLTVNIDGVDVSSTISLAPHTTPLRAASPEGFFDIIAPENNLFGGVPGQSYEWMTDGFYLIIAPLSPGPHTITFGGTSRNFASYVTYNIYVEP